MNIEILKDFGLTKNEISIFLILIKKGALSATEIAKGTGLNRPYVYYALERLLEKGYISEIKIKGKKNFRAVELNQIVALEEHKVDILKTLKLELENLQKIGSEDVSVEVLKGKYVIKNIFKKVISEIKPKDEILYIGIDEEKMEIIEPIYLRKILDYFKENKITERMIIKKYGRVLEYAKTTEYKFIDNGLIGNTAKIIYQDVVIELIYGEPVYAIVMRNKHLSETEKKQFEVFWKLAKK